MTNPYPKHALNIEKRNQLATPAIHVTLPSNGYVKQQRDPKRDKVRELEEGSAILGDCTLHVSARQNEQ